MADRFERINEVLETYRLALPEAPSNAPPQVCRACRYIKEMLFDPELTVQKLKEDCNINGNNFSGIFKYYMGKPPQQYIVLHRLQAAPKVLRTVNRDRYTLLELAYETGFSGHSAFTRSFKRVMEETPSAYQALKNVKGNVK
ncbi:helix-turn-helix domain-containing protein [Fodinibius halophilus]|uniref:Helix-turn-helix transcriptional regulator n=1 Tax=Fodinibius halophilus TaxID=1736908 RepID=A0A6M1T9E1_9BACT|nr:AraC family transcriptional regulator [Fodinibius halophilus]NGP90095.1 helix-turn-helix transcriptional regulator [Fodinibius halophilus]